MGYHSRSDNQNNNEIIWPGFVDILASTLMVVVFLVMIFTIAQIFLGDMIAGRDDTIKRLNQDLSEKILNIEELQSTVSQLADELSFSMKENEQLQNTVTNLKDEQQSLISSLFNVQEEKVSIQKQLNEVEKTLLQRNKEISQGLDQIALLQENVAMLTDEIRSLNDVLDAKEEVIANQGITIDSLGERLNKVLASELMQLQQYRSEFFGRLKDILADRSDISIKGDRFVFQSEVLFPSGSAELQPSGLAVLDEVANSLNQLISELPSDLNWIIQIDGHTDKVPIFTYQYSNNWVLSTARALSVVQFFISKGIPENKLSANGFGSSHPIAEGEDPISLQKNRRIELKITQL